MRKFSTALVAFAICAVLSSSPLQADRAAASEPPEKPATAARAIPIEAMPGWVRDRTIPETTKARVEQAENGLIYLLVDEQYRTRSDGHDDWWRSASKVINRSGLESAGQISVSYDPSFESLSVNFIHIIRDGKIIDLTQETQFRVVEREDELDDGIISGMVKSITNLRDLRVGDIVDYATTVHAQSTLWPGQAFYQFSQRYSDPVAFRALRLIWPPEMSARYKPINSDISFPTRKSADGTEWEWSTTDAPAMRAEKNVPGTAFQWGRVDVSTMGEWAEVVRWAAALYQGDDSLPDDFAATLDQIAAASPDKGERLTAAMRYVQDNIRYVGEELGEGSYVPRRPKLVLARAYGDCKDKALLLAVALRRLGIDAVPALVSARAGERLPDRLPSPTAFDHVIVRAVVDGKVIWIDATGAHRGGRGSMIVPSNLGYALPIRAGQTALEHIDGFGERAGRQTVLEQFNVDEAADVPLTLHVETRYTEARADNVRAGWSTKSAGNIAEDNLKFYRERFVGIVESKPLQITDDRDGNVVTMVENYTMSREAFKKAQISAKLTTRAYLIQNILPDRETNPRVQPLAISDHVVNEQTIELRVKDRVLDTLDDVTMKAGQISFSRKTSRLPDGLSMVYRLDTGASDVAPASDAEAIYAVSDKIADGVGIEFYLEKSARAETAPKGIDPATWAPIKDDVAKILALMQKSDQPSMLEALTQLSAVSAKVPHPSQVGGMLEGYRGAVLTELRRTQAAYAAFQAATAQYDGNSAVFRLWVGYELDLGTGETIAKAFQRSAKLHPDMVAALDEQWIRLALQKTQALPPEKREQPRSDICIALVEAGWQQKPRTSFGDTMLSCAIAAYSIRGELAAARAGLAQEPSTDTLVTLAIDRRHLPLWPEIDRIGADRFRRSLEKEAERTAAAAKAKPKNYSAVTDQMRALRALGRFQDALAAGKTLANDMAQIEVAGNDGFWLVNEYADNLKALGRIDDAIAAMDSVLALGVDRYPDLISIAINRNETVNAAGRFQAAFDKFDEIETQHLDKVSAFGKMWIWSGKACALRKLGREADAQAVMTKLLAKPTDNWSAVTAAAACANDVEAIADLLVSRLRDSDARSEALGLFLTFEAPETMTPFETSKHQAIAKARALPKVQAEFTKYGRAIRYAGTTQGWSNY